ARRPRQAETEGRSMNQHGPGGPEKARGGAKRPRRPKLVGGTGGRGPKGAGPERFAGTAGTGGPEDVEEQGRVGGRARGSDRVGGPRRAHASAKDDVPSATGPRAGTVDVPVDGPVDVGPEQSAAAVEDIRSLLGPAMPVI